MVPLEEMSLYQIISLDNFCDERGILSSIEFNQLPFFPKRTFFIANVKKGMVRGGHAHKNSEQLLIYLSGEIKINLAHDRQEDTYLCKSNGEGVFVPSGVWTQQTYLNDDSILLVLSSSFYYASDYIYERN
jgi:dTDP-4-dehydrorhamnose 3,5-epimerase-like enzyme